MRAQRLGSALAGMVAIALALPLLLATYPQMADYPAHLASWRVMLDGASDPDLARHYAFDWRWQPNLGAELLIRPLAALFGLEGAGRLLVNLLPLLVAGGACAVEWSLRRRIGIGAILACAQVWTTALLFGFLNYTLSLALALFAFAAWHHWRASRWHGLAFVPIGLAVWLCHLSGWGVLGVLAFGYEWQRRGLLRAIPATWPLWPPALLTLLGGGAGGFSYGDSLLNWKVGQWVLALGDQAPMLDLLTVLVCVAAPLAAWKLGRIDGRIGRGGLLLALLTMVVPRHLGGGDLADMRLVNAALLAGALAIDWAAPARWLALTSALVAGRAALTAAAWHAGSERTAQVLALLDHIPRGSVVAAAIVDHRQGWADESLAHVASYATVRRSAAVNSNFAIPGVHMLRLRDGGFADPSQRVFAAPGQPVDLSAFVPAGPSSRADYLWYVGAEPVAKLPTGAVVVATTNGAFLARLAKAPAQR